MERGAHIQRSIDGEHADVLGAAADELDAFLDRLISLSLSVAAAGVWRDRCAAAPPGGAVDLTEIELHACGDPAVIALVDAYRLLLTKAELVRSRARVAVFFAERPPRRSAEDSDGRE